MSQDLVLAHLRTFGPLSTKELAKTGMLDLSTVNRCLARLHKWGDVKNMEGKCIAGNRGRIALWEAV